MAPVRLNNMYFTYFKCKDDQFTCNNGICVSMYKRCNGLFDCPDESDEFHCNNVEINERIYRRGVPPTKHGSKVKIYVSVFLLNINRVELPTVFDCKIQLVLKWQDYRLTYKDLLSDGNTVAMDVKQKLWIPPLRFSNTKDGAILNNADANIDIVRSGQHQLNDQKELHEARIYKGDENFLVFTRQYEMIYKCYYNLQNYPFDSQECSIDLNIPSHQMDLMRVLPDHFYNNGSSKLEQFLITEVNLYALQNNSAIKFLVRMKRIPWFHVTTTYLPTLCIIVMVLVILFIDSSHFEATIMVALTAMLVMYTLFQSIATTMPQTAYLKLLDYWMFYGLIMPFVVFILLIIWELDYQTDMSTVKPMTGIDNEPRIRFIWCKYFLPLLTICFVISYLIVVLVVVIV